MSLIDDAIEEIECLVMINELITKRRSTFRKRSMTVKQIGQMTAILKRTITDLKKINEQGEPEGVPTED
jgi:hypothetical protein